MIHHICTGSPASSSLQKKPLHQYLHLSVEPLLNLCTSTSLYTWCTSTAPLHPLLCTCTITSAPPAPTTTYTYTYTYTYTCTYAP